MAGVDDIDNVEMEEGLSQVTKFRWFDTGISLEQQGYLEVGNSYRSRKGATVHALYIPLAYFHC
jgi:hypothetical protein